MLDEKNDQKMVKHNMQEIKIQTENYFKEVFQAEDAEIMETTKGYKIISVMIITKKDGSKLKLGLLENI